jgi:transketolase
MREVFIESLLHEAREDKDIVLITGDLGYGILDQYRAELPAQFINSGVNEQSMMGVAAGIASTGKKVFVYSIGNFSTLRCLEQIRNDVCLMNNPVVIVSVGAGYAYGAQGYTHHALEDIAVMRALPNIEVVSPADSYETFHLTKMLCKISMPSYFRLGKSKSPKIHTSKPSINFGDLVSVFDGVDANILFTGSVGTLAIEARQYLWQQGIDVGVISVPFLSSINPQQLSNLASNGPIITLEDHSSRGGLGGAVLETLASLRIFTKTSCVASNQINLSLVGDEDYLRVHNGISVEEISSRVMSLMAD